jgi:hypothetical protein
VKKAPGNYAIIFFYPRFEVNRDRWDRRSLECFFRAELLHGFQKC